MHLLPFELDLGGQDRFRSREQETGKPGEAGVREDHGSMVWQ